MPAHSKIASNANLKTILLDVLVGTTKKKIASGVLLAIIFYLIHVKNKKSATDNLKFNLNKDKQVIFLDYDRKEEKVMWTQYSLLE